MFELHRSTSKNSITEFKLSSNNLPTIIFITGHKTFLIE